MEDQMIFSALQTLSEDAQEDVLEEKFRRQFDINPNQEYQPEDSTSVKEEEIDMVFLKSSPHSSQRLVLCHLDKESKPFSESGFSPYKESTSVSRTSSLKCRMPNNELPLS